MDTDRIGAKALATLEGADTVEARLRGAQVPPGKLARDGFPAQRGAEHARLDHEPDVRRDDRRTAQRQAIARQLAERRPHDIHAVPFPGE
jgi:hypothetical protein